MPNKASQGWKTLRLAIVLTFVLIFFHEYTTEEINEIVGIFGLDQQLHWVLSAMGIGGGLEVLRKVHKSNK